MNIGIIGCGGIAVSHLNAVRHNNCEVTALCDVSEEICRSFAEKNNLLNVRIFTSIDELCAGLVCEAVIICSPPAFHEKAACTALKNGLHVMCEKPLAHTPASARVIEKAVKKSGRVFMPAFRHRFLPAIKKLRDILHSGDIGAPVHFTNIFCGPAFNMKDKWFSKKSIAGGGCMIDTSSHSVDLFRYIFGDITTYSCQVNRRLPGTDVEDSSVLCVRSSSGVLGVLQAGWVCGVGRAIIDIIGEKGRAVYDYTKPENIDIYLPENKTKAVSVSAGSGFNEEWAHFLEAIAGKTALSCTIKDGVENLKICSAISSK